MTVNEEGKGFKGRREIKGKGKFIYISAVTDTAINSSFNYILMNHF